MSTRGLMGFRVNGVDKLTYVHSNTSPRGLGEKTLRFLRSADPQKLAATASVIKLVEEDDTPTQQQREHVAQYLKNTGSQTADWFNTLREAQGNWEAWYAGLSYMMEYAGFITSCEWAYIYDVDTHQLEVYADACETLGQGRYNQPREDGRGIGARLLATIPHAAIHCLTDTQIGFICKLLIQQDDGLDLEDTNPQLPLQPLLKGRQGVTPWCPLALGWDIQISVNGPYATCVVRTENVALSLTADDGLQLSHPGYGAALCALLDPELGPLTTALYGSQACLAQYRKVMHFRKFLRQFNREAAGFPLAAIMLDGNAEWMSLRLRPDYFEQLKCFLTRQGLTLQAWKFLLKQPGATLSELLSSLAFSPSGLAFGVLQLNLMAAALQTETLVTGRIEGALSALRRICGWSAWSNQKGVHDESTPVQRENARLLVRALMRAQPDRLPARLLTETVEDVADYVRTCATPLTGATWSSLSRRSEQWHQQIQEAEQAKLTATWDTRLGVYTAGEYLALELDSAKALFEEGMVMHHCVKNPVYIDDCVTGHTRIFSLRKDGERCVTVELQRETDTTWTVGQVRGKYNDIPDNAGLTAAVSQLARAYGAAQQHVAPDNRTGHAPGKETL